MSADLLVDELRRFLAAKKQELAHAEELRSEVAALTSANARLHAQLHELQSRPAVALVFRASRALDDYPTVKSILKRLAKTLK